MAMKVNVIRHLAFEDLGSLGCVLKRHDADIRYFEAGVDDLSQLSSLSDDLLVILGGPISVNDAADYPFLSDELVLLERRLAADKPTLGVCLGAQLMAKALGAKVYSGDCKEIGWFGLKVSEAGVALGMAELDESETQMLHWHGETFDIPVGAVCLASSERFTNQAFSYGERCLALQFHPEVTARGLQRWFIGHTGEIVATEGVCVAQLRSDTQNFAPALEAKASAFFEQWLSRVM